MRYTFPHPEKLRGSTLLAELVAELGTPEDLTVRLGVPRRFDVAVNATGRLEVAVPDGTPKGHVARIIAAHRGLPSDEERAELVRRYGPGAGED